MWQTQSHPLLLRIGMAYHWVYQSLSWQRVVLTHIFSANLFSIQFHPRHCHTQRNFIQVYIQIHAIRSILYICLLFLGTMEGSTSKERTWMIRWAPRGRWHQPPKNSIKFTKDELTTLAFVRCLAAIPEVDTGWQGSGELVDDAMKDLIWLAANVVYAQHVSSIFGMMISSD